MKKIPLTQGKFALIDNEDFEKINQFKWTANKQVSGQYVAVRRFSINKKATYVRMHNFITGAPFVDHADGDSLNNTRKNLRPCTPAQNNWNRSNNKKPNSSKYKGVSFDKKSKKFAASIHLNNKKIHLGFFKNEADAALAYNSEALKLFGKFSKLNEVTCDSR